MKKIIITIVLIILLFIGLDFAYYHMGVYLPLDKKQDVECFMTTDEEVIYMNNVPFEIKGVDLLSSVPGKKPEDFTIDKKTYMRWFSDIQKMGANTIRIYTIQNSAFYKAFYEYNKDNKNPLYLLCGISVDDYVQNSRFDALDEKFFDKFLSDSKAMIDVIHGNKKLFWGEIKNAGYGSYLKDISKWVIGYILGSEWKDTTVSYTDDLYKEHSRYKGEYMYSGYKASPFECMLTKVGDEVIKYETERYNSQRLISFVNGPKTDPFEYPEEMMTDFRKCAFINTEKIKTTEKFLSGYFASYNVYPYYPDFLGNVQDWKKFKTIKKEDFKEEDGRINTYKAYIQLLNNYHSVPVVISEFGVPTSRGKVLEDTNTDRNYGNLTEKEQAEALLKCYYDIKDTGCAGACIYAWQDDWSAKTWNTLYSIDSKRTHLWNDVQSADAHFGLLSFEPGKEKSVVYVDGDASEWSESDVVAVNDDMRLSLKYDEKYIYMLVKKDNLDFENEKLFIPIDTTQKTGNISAEEYSLDFDRNADFLVVLDGKDNSRILVDKRYEALRSTFASEVYNVNVYDKLNIPQDNSSQFVKINLLLQNKTRLVYDGHTQSSKIYETGKLRYGNANPKNGDFDSLSDFTSNGDFIELKIAWQLLNFSDPSKMMVHDDYYDKNFGVEQIKIKKIYAGVCTDKEEKTVMLSPVSLSGWGEKVTYHERLKTSYYEMMNIWNS